VLCFTSRFTSRFASRFASFYTADARVLVRQGVAYCKRRVALSPKITVVLITLLIEELHDCLRVAIY
jgi:hypothetical protein